MCGENQYLCKKASPNQEHVRCIPNEWKCNGIRECEENDDELDCPAGINQRQEDYYSTECRSNQHKCYGTGQGGIPAKCLDRSQLW